MLFSSVEFAQRAKHLSRRLPDGFGASCSAFVSSRNILYRFDNAVLVFLPKNVAYPCSAKSDKKAIFFPL